jgi:hypothetical protein
MPCYWVSPKIQAGVVLIFPFRPAATSFKMQIWIMDKLTEQQMQNIEIGQFLLLLLCVQTNCLGMLRILAQVLCTATTQTCENNGRYSNVVPATRK